MTKLTDAIAKETTALELKKKLLSVEQELLQILEKSKFKSIEEFQTAYDNAAGGAAGKSKRKGKPAAGGKKRTRTAKTPELVKNVKAYLKNHTQKETAKKYGISQSSVISWSK